MLLTTNLKDALLGLNSLQNTVVLVNANASLVVEFTNTTVAAVAMLLSSSLKKTQETSAFTLKL